MLRFANVYLESASELISGFVEKEGGLDIKKARALIKPIILPNDSAKVLSALEYT